MTLDLDHDQLKLLQAALECYHSQLTRLQRSVYEEANGGRLLALFESEVAKITVVEGKLRSLLEAEGA